MRKGKAFLYLCDCECNSVHFKFASFMEWVKPDGTKYEEDGWLTISMEPNPHSFWVRFKKMWTYLFRPWRFFDGGEIISELHTDDDKKELRDLISFLQEALEKSEKPKISEEK